jgi:hypothetical protein
MRATVFLAPNPEASMHAVMFWLSLGVTAINKSALAVPASFKPEMEVGEMFTVIRSKLFPNFPNLSSFSSIRMMSCFSFASSFAKCVPTAPAPAMMIFMSSEYE